MPKSAANHIEKQAAPKPREHMLVGLFRLLPQGQRTRAYYVTLSVIATLIVIGLCREPVLTAVSVPGAGLMGWVSRLWNRI